MHIVYTYRRYVYIIYIYGTYMYIIYIYRRCLCILTYIFNFVINCQTLLKVWDASLVLCHSNFNVYTKHQVIFLKCKLKFSKFSEVCNSALKFKKLVT